MKIIPPANATDLGWLSLRSSLWPDGTEAEHLRYMADALRAGIACAWLSRLTAVR